MSDLAALEAKTYSKVDWRLIPFLFLCYILAYLDRVNVGFAKLQMVKDLFLSDAAFAFGAGIFFIGYFFFEVPSNILLKKFGARAWIARIMISWGVISSAMMFVHSERMFYVMRFLLAALCLYVVHVLFLVFEVESVYATRLSDWSAAHYGAFARNFWAAGFHFYQIAGRFAAPFAIWWFFGRPDPTTVQEVHRGPRRKKKRKG